MTVRQKLGMILENKVVQKLKLKNNDLTWYPKLIFLNETKKFDLKNRLSKYNLGTF